MTVTYFKRFRMQLRLDRMPISPDVCRELPSGYRLAAWSSRLLNSHADVKWASFREELDSHVFPCLGQRDGCRQLMREISGRSNFVPEATWLVLKDDPTTGKPQACGTIQGLLSGAREGAIQNIGVHPDCRDLGLGSVLLRQAIDGFMDVGCRYVHLEVTVQNSAAIRLYERFGFRRVETLFKVAEVEFA